MFAHSCPGDTFLNDDKTDCICENNYVKEHNFTCSCEYLLAATNISKAVCGCPDTSVLNANKTACSCPANQELNFTVMKCEEKLSASFLYGKLFTALMIIALTI